MKYKERTAEGQKQFKSENNFWEKPFEVSADSLSMF